MLRDKHPPNRSSRRTGSDFAGVIVSIDVRRDSRVFVFVDKSGRNDPSTEAQFVRSSSSKYFAFWMRIEIGVSVICAQPASFTYISIGVE